MSDERRERFAAAIQRRVVPEYTLAIILPEVYEAADAAMAVADDELGTLHAEVGRAISEGLGIIGAWEAECNLLRAELADMTAKLESMEDAFYEQG